MDLVLSCILKHKILPQVDLQSSVGKNLNHTVKAVLVASLYPEVYEETNCYRGIGRSLSAKS